MKLYPGYLSTGIMSFLVAEEVDPELDRLEDMAWARASSTPEDPIRLELWERRKQECEFIVMQGMNE